MALEHVLTMGSAWCSGKWIFYDFVGRIIEVNGSWNIVVAGQVIVRQMHLTQGALAGLHNRSTGCPKLIWQTTR